MAIARLQTTGVVCIEKFSDFPQMGRFTLRDEGENFQFQWSLWVKQEVPLKKRKLLLPFTPLSSEMQI